MASFKQPLLLFLALALSIAITPAFSFLGFDEPFYPNTAHCWDKLYNTADGCGHQIYASLINKKISLTFECCEAINGLDLKCKNWIFNRGRFTPEFGDQIKGFCETLGVILPPSYRVYFPDHDEIPRGIYDPDTINLPPI